MKTLPSITNRLSGEIVPDESINTEEFNRQYELNPDRWDKAFAFLADTDLINLPAGRYDIEGSDLYASVDEYVTKDKDEARFEAHRKYADIQYIIAGEERMGLLPLDKTAVTVPYDAFKDIVFLKAVEENYRHATSERYLIFFPSDAHKPCVKIREKAAVKKVVVKVRL